MMQTQTVSPIAHGGFAFYLLHSLWCSSCALYCLLSCMHRPRKAHVNNSWQTGEQLQRMVSPSPHSSNMQAWPRSLQHAPTPSA